MIKKEILSPKPDQTGLPYGVASPSGSGIFSTDSPMTAQLRCVMLKEKKLSFVHMDTEKKWQNPSGKQQVSFCSDFLLRRKPGGRCGKIKRAPGSERGKAERDF